MSKHTLGPWYISDQYIRYSDRKAICQWGSYTDEADARLIAEAPELLRLVKTLELLLRDRTETSHLLNVAMEQARTAIAKAEGGS